LSGFIWTVEGGMTQVESSSLAIKEIPVTIVTGFLGSGKTTLVNRILTERHGQRIAVILNEIGEVNLDSEFVLQADEDLKVMNNGCLCCTVRDDLSRICLELVERGLPFDAMLIETTGLADPSPVAQTFILDERINQHYYLDGVVTIVDAKHIEKNLIEAKETQEQIGFADRIILNKSDLLTDEENARLKERLSAMNSQAKLYESVHCDVPIRELFGIEAFDLNSRLEITPALGKAFHEHSHDDDVESVYLEVLAPLNLPRFERFMSLAVEELGGQLLRYKGVVYVAGVENRFLFQGVHAMMGANMDRPWKPGETRKTQIVFIGRYIPKEVLREGLEMCYETAESNAHA
jgi:G3E family GTPase